MKQKEIYCQGENEKAKQFNIIWHSQNIKLNFTYDDKSYSGKKKKKGNDEIGLADQRYEVIEKILKFR